MGKPPVEPMSKGEKAQAPMGDAVHCPSCSFDNKGKAKNCRKCGYDLSLPALWIPNWKWHIKVLGIIYAALFVGYFVIDHFLKQLPPPYDLRDIPIEATPWLKK